MSVRLVKNQPDWKNMNSQGSCSPMRDHSPGASSLTSQVSTLNSVKSYALSGIAHSAPMHQNVLLEYETPPQEIVTRFCSNEHVCVIEFRAKNVKPLPGPKKAPSKRRQDYRVGGKLSRPTTPIEVLKKAWALKQSPLVSRSSRQGLRSSSTDILPVDDSVIRKRKRKFDETSGSSSPTLSTKIPNSTGVGSTKDCESSNENGRTAEWLQSNHQAITDATGDIDNASQLESNQGKFCATQPPETAQLCGFNGKSSENHLDVSLHRTTCSINGEVVERTGDELTEQSMLQIPFDSKLSDKSDVVTCTSVEGDTKSSDSKDSLVCTPSQPNENCSLDEVTGSPNELTGSPNELTGSPEELTGSPNELTGSPNELTGSPEELTGSPNELAGSPNELTGSPNELTGSPNEFTGSPNEPTGSPDELTGSLGELSGSPASSGVQKELPDEKSLQPTNLEARLSTLHELTPDCAPDSIPNRTPDPTPNPTPDPSNPDHLSLSDNAVSPMEMQDAERCVGVSTDASYLEPGELFDIKTHNHDVESSSRVAALGGENSFNGDESTQDTCEVHKSPQAQVDDGNKLEIGDELTVNKCHSELDTEVKAEKENIRQAFETILQSLDSKQIDHDNAVADVTQSSPTKKTELETLSEQSLYQIVSEENGSELPESPSLNDASKLTESSTTDEGSTALDGGLKKMVTEVCACDTTTGSTDDELNGNVILKNTLDQIDKSVKNIESKSCQKSEMQASEKRDRKQWARELAKVRVKNQERKKLARQAAILRARQTRRKVFELQKTLNVNRKTTAAAHVPKSTITTKAANTPAAKSTDTLSENNLPAQGSDAKEEVKKSSEEIVSAPTDDNTQNLNNSANIDLGPIEIVEDDEDDGDPWPFIASPATMSNMPTPNSACSIKSQSPTPSLDQELPFTTKSAKHDASLQGSMKIHGLPEILTHTSPVKESVTQVIASVEKDSNESDMNNAKDLLSDVGNAQVASNLDKALTSPTAVPLPDHTINPATPSSPGDTEVSSPPTIEEWSPEDVVNIPNSPIDQTSHAKMQRSCEVQRTNSLADSMWKDMFNSEVAPLDFDSPTSVVENKPEDRVLPAIFSRSLGLVRKKKPATPSTSGYVNTPCGDSYPADPKPLPAITASTLKLCSCKSTKASLGCQNKAGESKPGSISFCQAVETIGNRVSSCVRSISEKTEGRRVSSRFPYMELCKQHIKKLTQHSCCPVCGLFCSGGNFLDCTSGKGHLHHKACQVKTDEGVYLCPHCGEKSSQVSVVLLSKSDTETQKTKQSSRKQNSEGIARMCIRMVTKATNSVSDDASNHSYDNKLFEVSRSKLLNGAEKNKLITIMSSLEHMVPAMKERLTHGAGVTTVYDLSSCILKNDLSQLALGICDVMHSAANKLAEKYPLNKPFAEHEGKTLLHLAVQSGSLATVHCLVMAGVALNSADYKGVTPLMLAAKGNQLDILKYLIGAGALVEMKDGDGMTPLHMAAVAGNKTICEYLLSEVKANIDCIDEGGWTPLVWAIENGHTHVVKLLLNSDASIHKRDSEGNASIHWGAYSGNTDIIKLLITRGADIEAVNELGDRPLHIAVRQVRTDAVILLLSHGADTSALNNLHETPAECCHGACSENMKSFLTVNDVLRSSKIGDIITRSSRLLHQDIARGKEKVPIPVTNDVDDVNYPTDFTYVTESVWTSRVPVNTMINSLSRCECSGDCSRASCSCARSSIACWYDQGVLTSSFDFTNPPQIYECNMACGCWATCNNRVVQHGITSQLELFKTKCRGWGVRARHEILKGSFVCEYVGELITDSEADTREDDSYLFDLDYKDGDTYCMDAKHYGNISRFINHRCEPNLTPVSVFIDHQDTRFPRICLFANTDIEPGTELGFDYGEKFWLVKYKQFLCDCGCKTCKYNKENIDATVLHHQQTSTSPSKKSNPTT